MIPLLLLLALQQSGEIRGRVVDAAGGEPLARVEVQLLGGSRSAVTDAGGRFVIAPLAEGRYTLQVSTVGYRLLLEPFSLAAGERKEFEVILSADMLRRTDSVEVRAGPFALERADSPSEISLTAVETKNLASVLADDPLRAVQGLPGVASNDDFKSQFSLRGADYRRTGLYLDDVLLHAPFHMVAGEPSSGSLTLFQGDMVEDISLHAGAPPSRFADRTAGALEVHTRDGTRLAPSYRFTASASNSGFLAEGPLGRGRRGSWMAGIRKSYLQYLIRRITEDPTLAFGFIDGQARLTYDLGRRHGVSLGFLDGRSDGNRENARDRLGMNSLMLSRYHLTLANLSWRYAPHERLLVINRLAYMRERFDNRNRDRLDLEAGYYGEWVWNASASWIQCGRSSLDAGWSLRRIRDDGFTNRYQFNPFAVQRLEDYRGNALRAGGFIEQSWSPAAGRFHVSAGARWDRHSVGGMATVSPHASFAMTPVPSLRVLLGWGQYAQYPELPWLFSRFGGIRLLPERANHVLAAVEQRIGERTRLRAEFYQRDDRDLLFRPFYEPRIIGATVFNPPSLAPARNSLRGYARGVEVFLQRRSANRLAGWISYAYGRARLRDGEARIAFPADQDQRHTVNAYASWRIRPSVNLSVKGLYGSGFPIPGFLRRNGTLYFLDASRNALRLDAYRRLDARINKAFTFDRWKLTLYAEVVNLTNARNYRFDSFNGYNSRTGRASVTLGTMFPVIPSAGVAIEFGGPQ